MLDEYHTEVLSGVGAIGRFASGVVVCGGVSDEEAADQLAAIVDAVGGEPTSGMLVERIRSDPMADVAAIVSAPDGLRLMVAGSMDARGVDNRSMAGDGLTEKTLPAETVAVWIGRGEPPTTAGHPAMNLVRGVVRGGGVVVYRQETPADDDPRVTGAPALPAVPDGADDAQDPTSLSSRPPIAPAQPPIPAAAAPESSPAVSRNSAPFEAIDWSGPGLQRREPLPVLGPKAEGSEPAEESPSGGTVLGIRCSRGHFNNPKASYCQVCGISMIHLTHRLEPGPRPTLGFMVFDDGATYAVDRPYLLGRHPMPSDDGLETALAIDDIEHSVSREHARIQIDGWDLHYVDLHSTNGSFLWNADTNRWDPITPETPVLMETGCTVSVGHKTFVFEAASRAVGG